MLSRMCTIIHRHASCPAWRAGAREGLQLGGLLARELLRQARQVFSAHAGVIMPAAFISRFDPDKEVAAVWGEVWEEGGTSQSAAVRLYMTDLVPLVQQGAIPCTCLTPHGCAIK